MVSRHREEIIREGKGRAELKRSAEKRKTVHFRLCRLLAAMGIENFKFALLFIVAFTFLQIIFFREILNHHHPIDGRTVEVGKVMPVFKLGLKPWPTLSSYQPWTPDPSLKHYTCEAYFGNGFIEEHRIIDLSSKDQLPETKSPLLMEAPRGSFRCLYSKTLRTSICEGKHVVMNTEKITVARGGENISEVIGRDEDEELPEFSDGAFQVQLSRDLHHRMRPPLFNEVSVDNLMPRGKINKHTLRSLLRKLSTVDSRNVVCSTRVAEPTVIVTRFEYANLFHTSTDWFSAYISSRIVGLQGRPRLVLLDGHCESPMDDGWKAMFTGVTYAKHYSGRVCFDHAIFAPLGYDIPIFKHIETHLNCWGCSVEALDNETVEGGTERKMARLREFGEFFAKSFDIAKGAAKPDENVQEVNVLFVRRENYLAHPRHSGRPESRLSNEGEVYEALTKWAGEKSDKPLNVSIVNGLLAHMNLEEQIFAVKKADVLVGAHGAGLTHLVFANPSTIVFELSSPLYRRPHFATMSYWMGMDYRVINMDSSFANIDQVINEMNEILEVVKRRKYP